MSQEIRRDALIVGINTYEYPRLKGLKAPAQDAEAIARMLTKYGNFRVRRLPAVKDKENLENDLGRVGQTTPVTLTQLEEALNQLFLPEGDYTPETALLFFSGHGLRKQKGRRYEGYLATSDVNPDKHHWGFSLQDLREILQYSPVRQQIVWLDCCHSGELFNFKENSQETIFLEEENLDEADPGNQEERDRCFITASRAFEVAREKASGTHGLLAAALLKGLNPEERPDGWVTTHTLADFINQELKTETQRPLCHNSGSPIILTTCKPQSVNSPDEGICPYKGLEYFKQEDAHFFWGRTALTDELIEQVRKNNFIALLGASGNGKSSVLRAGLLHQLNLGVKLTGSNRWQIYQPFTPGEHPIQNLEAVIGRSAHEWNQLVTEAETSRVVLVVDQFEECFTMCKDSREREQFFDCLLSAVEREDNKLCLVLGMRADFLGKCAEYAGLASKLDKHLVTVKPMTSKELKEAIIKPAEQVGLGVQEQLVTRMIEDVADSPGSLPLLQYTLMELWKARREPLMNWLTLFSYEQLGGDKGGIKGILEERANKVYESLNEEEKPVAQRIFLELTQLGEVADTRRRARKEDLINSQHSEALLDGVIRKLAEARLITTTEAGLSATSAQSKSQDSQPTQTNALKPSKLKPNAVIDITHEALIRHWEKLRHWVEDYRIPLEIEHRIEADARGWAEQGRPESLLLREGRLAEAQNYKKDYLNLGFLDGVAQEFIEESIKLRRFTHKKEQQQALFLAYLVIEAVTKATIAELGELAALARLKNPVDGLITAIKLTGESQNKLRRVLDSVQTTLFDLLKKPVESNILIGHKKNVTSVAFSRDGSYIASGSEDRTVRLWDLKGNPVSKPFQGHEDYINSIAFSPDSCYIVTASSDKTVRLWDLKGNPITILKGHENVVSSVAFSPDGKYIVSGGYDGMRLWDREGNLNQPLVIYSERVFSVAFSPDGQTIASANWKAVQLWDLKSNPIGEPIKVHEYAVYSVAFSSDGQYIVTSGTDGIVKVVNLKEEKDIRTIDPESDSHVNSVALSPYSNPYSDSKSTYLAIASGKTVRIKNLDGYFIGQALEHEDKVTSVAFSPDGQYIVTGNWDRTVRLWELRNLIEPLPSPEDHQALLQVACRRLFSHSMLVEAKTEEARAACETCQKYVWDKTQTAQFLLNQGRAIARWGIFEEAVAKLKQAQEFAPIPDLDPEAEARSLAAFAQFETETNLTVNQILLPDLPNYATYGQVKLSDFTLHNQENVVRVAPGEKISAFTQYIYDCPGCQRGSSNQIIVGIAGQNQAQACIYNGSIQGSGSSQFTLTAPDEPGIYYIRFRYAQAYECDTALGWWRVDGEPTSEANIGAIVVMEQG